MNIVLDTNILRQDLFLTSRKVEMLMDFISKTDYEVVLPHVVHAEILAIYERQLVEEYGALLKAKNGLEKSLREQLDVKVPELDIKKQVELFGDNISKKLKIRKDNLVPLNNEHLPELVYRAVKRIHPFTEHRSEFRDALIWLTCLDLAREEEHKSIVLISANAKDFADKSEELHQSLQEEARREGVHVAYYQSLDSFLKTKASQIEFITDGWLEANIDMAALEKDLLSNVERHNLQAIGKRLRREDEVFAEILSVGIATTPYVLDFYVYEMSDGSYRVEAALEGDLDVQYATNEVIVEDWDWDYDYLPAEGTFGFGPVFRQNMVRPPGVEMKAMPVGLEYHLIIEGGEIKSAELIDCFV